MNKRIELTARGATWVATFTVNGQPDHEIVELFETHVIPTSYSVFTDGEKVLHEVSLRNPDHVVVLVES